MKKTILAFIVFSVLQPTGYSQVYNPVNYNYNVTPTHGVKIKTNLPFIDGSQMPTLIFEGYSYGTASTIGISLVYYIYGGNFYQPKASSWGGYTPVIKLANENNKVVIFIDDRVYYQRFSIRAFAQGIFEISSWFQGWTVVDEPISGSNITTVPYQNSFSGNIYFPGSSIWTSEGKIGVGTLSPGSKLELYQESADNSNLIMASLNRGGTMTGGSNILRIGYYATSDLEQNGMYSSSGWRYGSWADLNIVNNGYSTYGGINLVTQSNVRMSILSNGNTGIGTLTPAVKLDVNGTGRFWVGGNQINNITGTIVIGGAGDVDLSYSTAIKTINTASTPDYWRPRMGLFTQNVNTYLGSDLVERVSILSDNGNVGIGTTNPENKLDVNGTIRAKEIKATLDNWSDYVFDKDYKLMSLSDVENYIKTNNKLPEIPSADEVAKEGVNLGEMNARLLQKIEELTLYAIDQNNKNELQSREIESLKQEIAKLKCQGK